MPRPHPPESSDPPARPHPRAHEVHCHAGPLTASAELTEPLVRCEEVVRDRHGVDARQTVATARGHANPVSSDEASVFLGGQMD
jgi:hypothetical protein